MVTQKVQKRKGVRQVYTEKFLWYNVQDYHGVLGAPAAATEESFMQRARELIRDIFRQTDLVLLALCCIATAFGILMIYSATRYMNTLRLVLVQTGGAVIGINVDTLDGNADAISTAKSLLESKGASYQNIYFPSDSAAGDFAGDIMAFPTTYVIDRSGAIVGEAMLGGIDNEDNMAALQTIIDQVLAADMG